MPFPHTSRLFDEGPEARRRLMLIAYGLIGPAFSVVLFQTAERSVRWQAPGPWSR
jgi:hypothetical protein